MAHKQHPIKDSPDSYELAHKEKLRNVNEIIGTPPPSKLYKYTTSQCAQKILTNNEIYFAKPSELNDPFDGRHVLNFTTREKRIEIVEYLEFCTKKGGSLDSDWEAIKRHIIDNPSIADELAKKIMDNSKKIINIGFFCMSSVKDSLLMWAHYADSHTGCCLIFDFTHHWTNDKNNNQGKMLFPFLLIGQIQYADRLPDDGVNYGHFLYKLSAWKYEEEWRAVMLDKGAYEGHPHQNQCNGHGLYKLDKGCLHGVILGHKMNEKDKKGVIVAARNRNIKIYEASPELYEYKLNIKETDHSRRP